MSRVGNAPIFVPDGAEVTIGENSIVTVKGPKGELTREFPSDITITLKDNELTVTRKDDTKEQKQIHGTVRSVLNNMVVGVTQGFSRELEIIGVGYRASKQGNKLIVNAGYSNPVELDIPEGLEVELPTNTEIIVRGFDKELVGEFAANIRAIRKPEPYKGKGIRYKDEYVIRKEGKKATSE